ncbi:hypothetical protein GIB67_024638 [Kingdonia uniflora]|uniref:Uncharacterized protein n=1 Tax=Kingdonia uniflora TaxID=39325 RepID=A0A7J7LP19_9MAGN|nr:hypothetical protein GIB67_024638 [Kingdonia uniflora]
MDQQFSWGDGAEGWRKGPWTTEEDKFLIEYVGLHGERRWSSVSRFSGKNQVNSRSLNVGLSYTGDNLLTYHVNSGLNRNGKSCRLRWVNYLRPDLKKGKITPQEENVILEQHSKFGNRWSTIARSLPGRTDNEIKNYWRTHFKDNGKASLAQSEKSAIRLLKRQQFRWQQQQQQQQQNQVDAEKFMSLSDETAKRVAPPVREEISFSSPKSTEEQHLLNSMFHGVDYVPEPSTENILWGGLWNFDDVHAELDSMCAPSRAIVQTQTTFC